MQIFISYSRVDTENTERLIRRLKRTFPDATIWYDSHLSSRGGQKWWDAILDAIEASEVFLYLLSNDALESPYCQAEFQEAQRLERPFIAVQMRDRTKIPDSLADYQYIDLSRPKGEDDPYDDLVASINRLLPEGTKAKRKHFSKKARTPKPIQSEASESAKQENVVTAPLQLIPASPNTSRGMNIPPLLLGLVLVLLIGIVVFFLFLMNQSPVTPDVSPTASPSPTLPTATATASRTPTATPSLSPSPSPSSTPTTMPTSAVEGVNAQVIQRDDFDGEQLSFRWQTWNQRPSLEDGELVFTGRGSWLDAITRAGIRQNEGVLMRFYYAGDFDSSFTLEKGEFDTSSFYVWGLFGTFGSRASSLYARAGLAPVRHYSNFSLNQNIWYYVLLRVGNDGEFTTQIWQDSASVSINYLVDITESPVGENWNTGFWTFILKINQGTIRADFYEELLFSEN